MDQRKLRDFIAEFVKALSDVSFEHIVTTRMLPTIYMAGIFFAAGAALFLVASSWEQNSVLGRIVWTGFFAPILFVGVVTLWRVLLELTLSLFEIAIHVRAMHQELQKVSGVTDEIATDLPRFQFWRTRRSGQRNSE